jgi:hypothetical protein
LPAVVGLQISTPSLIVPDPSEINIVVLSFRQDGIWVDISIPEAVALSNCQADWVTNSVLVLIWTGFLLQDRKKRPVIMMGIKKDDLFIHIGFVLKILNLLEEKRVIKPDLIRGITFVKPAALYRQTICTRRVVYMISSR